MTQTRQTPDSGPGLANSIITDPQSNIPKNPAVQAAVIDLRRDFVSECLRIAAVKAAHGADNIALNDDLCAERDIRIAVENLREAAASFRQLQRDTAEAVQ
jgi:hypothetical protein